MPLLLHVGSGLKRKAQTTPEFNRPEWSEIRLDIDPGVEPDVSGTMTDMAAVESASVDAIFSSHNIEHLYPHEVPLALKEFKRVLKPEGYVVITCPDLQSVCALVAQNKLTDPAYTSPAGPIAPLDMLYGYRPAMAHGNLFMAHRCGFTRDVLAGTMKAAGFRGTVVTARPQYFDLWAVSTQAKWTDAELTQTLMRHLGAAQAPSP